MAEIRVLRVADKAKSEAERLFTHPMFHNPTPADELEAHVNAIRAQWVCRGLPVRKVGR
jgi:hypothetical protein